MADIRKNLIFGFAFGLFFLGISYLAGLYIDHFLWWFIPFLVSALCGLGAVIAVFAISILESKGFTNHKNNLIIGFTIAALVNVIIVFIILTTLGLANLQKDIILGGVLGLVLGGIYAIHHYRMDRINERMKFLEQLSEKNKQLQEATRKLTLVEERNRMGRDLHDSVAQGLHGLVFSVHSLKNNLPNPPAKVEEILKHMEATASFTLDELKTIIDELKPSLLVEEGLQEALEMTINLFSQRANIQVEKTINLPEGLNPEIEMVIYRLFQEALANIEKHAEADLVKISISDQAGQLLITISDNGQGFIKGKPDNGNGLLNMKQRVEDIAGSIEILSKPSGGTSIIVKIPQKG